MGDRGTERLRISVEPDASRADVDAVGKGLRAFNVARIGAANEVATRIFLRDAGGEVVGGLLGEIRWRWLYVAKLWVADEQRGRGYGADLLAAAESFAREHDCIGVYLDTFEYQARPFYEKYGYELFGTLDGYPPGYRQYHLAKRLV
jgi:GNAT superfamily N-acetyltransferase